MAIAGLLVKSFLDFCGDGIRILHDGISEKVRVHRCWKFALRGPRMIRGHWLIGCGLRGIRTLRRARSGLPRNQHEPKRKDEERRGVQEFPDSISPHTRPRSSLNHSTFAVSLL